MTTKPAQPLFIIGFFRSGTSLLYSLVNQHPQVALMYESNVWDFPASLGAVRFGRNWLERLEFYSRALSRHRLTFGDSLRGLEQVRTPDDLYRCFSQSKTARFWGEKSPAYCTELRRLARRYPEASFILIWRNPLEIYQSVMSAGRGDRFFKRRAMLSRMIYGHEVLICEAAELARQGTPIHQVTYDDLVDQPEQVCRGICGFLHVDFDPRMLDLAHADFSAVDHAPHHQQLRSGVISRRKFKSEPLTPRVIAKLERFHARWNRLTQAWAGKPIPALAGPEPTRTERLWHEAAGAALSRLHSLKRLLFEFLPMPWLKAYRQTKAWLLQKKSAASHPQPSLRQGFAEHWATILASYAVLGLIAFVQHLSNPHFMFTPFHLVPCGVLTLILGRRWGIFAAAIASITGPVLQFFGDSDYAHPGVLFWNIAMRFLLLAVVVTLLDRVREETRSVQEAGN